MYSIVELNNKQYRIEEGKPVLVDLLGMSPDENIKIDKVLLFHDDKDVEVGTPYIKGMSLTAKVLDQAKGRKIRVYKYKKRKDYRRTIGSRPRYTRIVVEKLSKGA